MGKKVNTEGPALREKATDAYYSKRIADIKETAQEWSERMQYARSWYESDSYAIGSNKLQEKGISLAFEAAQKSTDPKYKERFYRECLDWGIFYYDINPPSLAFKLFHPRISSMFKEACREYTDAAKELIESKEYNRESELFFMKKIVFYENMEKLLTFFHAVRN